jgi:histidinol-phosphatase (PHP family)
MINMHAHTDRCGHASGTPSDLVEAAARAGVTVLAFTDHLPLPHEFEREYAMAAEELEEYVHDVSLARDRGAQIGVEVLMGIEADWLPEHPGHVEELLAEHDFDLVLGSVHFLDGWAFDDPRLIDHYAGVDVDALWARYFEVLAEAANSSLYDVMAHPDLIKKFGFMPREDPEPLYHRTAAQLALAGVAIEVNTAGLRKPCAEIYPTAALLKACRAAGVPATIGTDAHSPGEIAAGLAEGYDALRQAGYESVTVFRGGYPEEVPL